MTLQPLRFAFFAKGLGRSLDMMLDCFVFPLQTQKRPGHLGTHPDIIDALVDQKAFLPLIGKFAIDIASYVKDTGGVTPHRAIAHLLRRLGRSVPVGCLGNRVVPLPDEVRRRRQVQRGDGPPWQVALGPPHVPGLVQQVL